MNGKQAKKIRKFIKEVFPMADNDQKKRIEHMCKQHGLDDVISKMNMVLSTIYDDGK